MRHVEHTSSPGGRLLRVRGMTIGLGCAALLASSTARATYSICAVDQATREVGGAVTSCVGALSVSVVYGSAPGKGVVHAQALLDGTYKGKNKAIELLQGGTDPAGILGTITASSFDAQAQSRQYGIVDLSGRAAGFTGTLPQSYKHDLQKMASRFSYSVQGNILTGAEVLTRAATSFDGEGCDLADKLMLALEAGAKNGQGDSRCTPFGIPSDSAMIQVDREGASAGSYLHLEVTNTKPNSPLPLLRKSFDTWRQAHPCETPPDAGADAASSRGGNANEGGAGDDGSSGGRSNTGGGGASGEAAGRGGLSGGNEGARNGGGHGGSAADNNESSGGRAATGQGGGSDAEGCTSSQGPASPGAAALFWLTALFLQRRRRTG